MSPRRSIYTAEIGGTKLPLLSDEDGVRAGDSEVILIAERRGLRSFTGRLSDGTEIPIYVERGEDHEYTVYLRGEAVRIRLVTPRDERLQTLRTNTAVVGSAAHILRAPMPGLLKAVLVSEGQRVSKGESLCILEAMKMENEIKSPDRLVVSRLLAQPGSAVEKGAPLVELEPFHDQE